MRLLMILFLVLSSVPALAGEYTPWIAVQAGPGQDSQGQQQSPTDPRRWYCCRHCSASEKPCNGVCVSGKTICKSPPGCACANGEGNL